MKWDGLLVWGGILDWSALIGVLTVLVFLICNRVRYRRWVMTVPTDTVRADGFGSELTGELLRQRVSQTFAAVSQTLDREFETLVYGLTGDIETGNGAFVWSQTPGGGKKRSNTTGTTVDKVNGKDADYYDAFKLAAKGENADTIRTRAGLTEGEAELIFNLQKFQTGS